MVLSVLSELPDISLRASEAANKDSAEEEAKRAISNFHPDKNIISASFITGCPCFLGLYLPNLATKTEKVCFLS